MLKIIAALMMCLAGNAAMAQDSAIGNETPTADQANDKAEATTVAAVKEEPKEEKEFQPPQGFQTKKRGAKVLYCKKDRDIGTRFVTEKCYDETQMREYLLARDTQRRDVERTRSMCVNAAVCSNP